MKKSALILLILLYTFNDINAHSGKPKYHVIIDTDGAIDDMRAISMFLAGNDIHVLAVIGSHGTLSPYSSSLKVNSLLRSCYHEGIPVGTGRETNIKPPVWNKFAESIQWGTDKSQEKIVFPSASVLLNKTIKNYSKKITLIALGSLTTYADLLVKNPEYISKIESVIWYNDANIETGFNYNADSTSLKIIKKLNIPLKIVSNNRNDLICDTTYLSFIQNVNSVYAKQIYSVHQQSNVSEKVKEKHLKLWDDLLPLYLTVPIIFTNEKKENITYVSIDKKIPLNFIYETVAELLISGTRSNNRTFRTFPVDTSLYIQSIIDILPETLKKYGETEWKAIALTNEIHGHTGIYSIIGAKMGVRACEYFNVGINNLQVTSFAGRKPPLSCLNDGIQISTGATIGQGLITVSDSIYKIPTVIFEFNGQKIKMTLKDEIAEKIRNEIKQGIKDYGLLSEKYWIYIEESAVQYWSNFDRHNIFIIKKL